MTGEGRLDRYLCCLKIPDLTDHDDIRVLSDDMSQRVRKVQADLGFHLDLIYPFQLVFDRVFNGYDFFVRGIDLIQCPVKCCGFSASCRTCNKDNAVWFCDQLIERSEGLRSKSQELKV